MTIYSRYFKFGEWTSSTSKSIEVRDFARYCKKNNKKREDNIVARDLARQKRQEATLQKRKAASMPSSDSVKKSTLNLNAKEFSLNPTANEFTPQAAPTGRVLQTGPVSAACLGQNTPPIPDKKFFRPWEDQETNDVQAGLSNLKIA